MWWHPSGQMLNYHFVHSTEYWLLQNFNFVATGWWWSQNISSSFCYQFVHNIILSGLSCTGFYLHDTLYAALKATSQEIQASCLHSSQFKMKHFAFMCQSTYRRTYLLLNFSIYNPKFNQAQSAKRRSGAPDADMFRNVHNIIPLLISWRNLGKHASRLSHCSFLVAAGWFGRRSFIQKDSTPTTYGNSWRGIKLVQIPNNAVCLNLYPKQKMMYIQLCWKICPKLLQSQAYSCTSVRIQDLS